MPSELQPPKSPAPLELTASPAAISPDANDPQHPPDDSDAPSSGEQQLFGHLNQGSGGAFGPQRALIELLQSRGFSAGGDDDDDDDAVPRPRPGMAQADTVLDMMERLDEQLHPYVATLGLGDLDACVALENAAFPEHERCSREKFQYRLNVCPDLSLGLFTSTTRAPDDETRACFEAARAPDSHSPDHKALLIGHVIATLTTADHVTDSSMSVPSNFLAPQSSRQGPDSTASSKAGNDNPPPVPEKEPPPVPRKEALPAANQPDSAPGHHPLGRTLAVHSVCILPAFQHLLLGTILFRGYLQRMESSGIADHAALLARSELVDWYKENFKFLDKGTSIVTFGGGEWRDLRLDFSEIASPM